MRWSELNETIQQSDLSEGVNDKHIFKAIFTAGGPGSGKTTVSKKILAHLGFKEVNVDRFIEFLASKNDLDLKDMDNWDRETKSKAHALNKSQLDLYIDGRLPLIIDGTGRNYDKIIKLSNDLKAIGYETGLLFVNTDLETAQQRNAKRERSVAPEAVETIWKQTQANLGKFQNYFGNHMFIVDSSATVDIGGASKRIDSFINEPVKSPVAKKWINGQKPITETSSAGATGAGNVATTNGAVGGLGVGFDPNGDWGIYEFAKKKRKTVKESYKKKTTKFVTLPDNEEMDRPEPSNGEKWVKVGQPVKLKISDLIFDDGSKYIAINNLFDKNKVSYYGDINEPVAVTEINGKYFLLNGYHRATIAYNENNDIIAQIYK